MTASMPLTPTLAGRRNFGYGLGCCCVRSRKTRYDAYIVTYLHVELWSSYRYKPQGVGQVTIVIVAIAFGRIVPIRRARGTSTGTYLFCRADLVLIDRHSFVIRFNMIEFHNSRRQVCLLVSCNLGLEWPSTGKYAGRFRSQALADAEREMIKIEQPEISIILSSIPRIPRAQKNPQHVIPSTS
ncbi:hypothetical protein F4861DRAFT_483464 [Xylaria intraflava]|nr:hypothetical protein F4861DRAFT_483464 [Xylaria intraflava]